MATHINKVELQGMVGSVRFFPVTGQDGPRMARFSMATNYYYMSREGMATIDTTWHSLSLFESKANELDWLEKGKAVHIIGRLRNVRYVDNEGHDRTVTDIVVEDMYQVKD